MSKLKFLILFILVLLIGCSNVEKDNKENLMINEINKKYYSFFNDLSSIIDTDNVSISMNYDKENELDNDFSMRLDTITENDNFKDIYFSLFLADNNGVEIYHKNNKTIIGFKNKEGIKWYHSDMTVDSIINLENNTTSITNIFDGYIIKEVNFIDNVMLDNIIFDKVNLKLFKENNSSLFSEYICYINTKTNLIEQIDVVKVDNLDANYSIFIKPIISIKELPKLDLEVLENMSFTEFDNKFLELLLNSIGNSLDISDISDLQ